MIQIQEPGIEALIQQRMTAGGFQNIEDALRQALTDAPLPASSCSAAPRKSGANLLEVLLNSPYKEVSLEGEHYYSRISDPVEF